MKDFCNERWIQVRFHFQEINLDNKEIFHSWMLINQLKCVGGLTLCVFANCLTVVVGELTCSRNDPQS